MATVTYVPIATNTLVSNSTTVTFSSIPQIYTDLIVVFSGKSDGSSASLIYQMNADSGSSYSSTSIKTNGASIVTVRDASSSNGISTNPNGFINQSLIISYFMNYSNSTTYKTVLSRANTEDNQSGMTVDCWRNTNALTSLVAWSTASYIFLAGSVFTLYGIKAE